MSDELDEYFEHARRDMFPKMKAAAISITIVGDPDPKLCLELGAAILFDKPILVAVPKGRKVLLALRTIANKIVELDPDDEATTSRRMKAAIEEMMEAGRFRGGKPQ